MGIFSSKSVRSLSPTELASKSDDEPPFVPYANGRKASTGGKSNDGKSGFLISRAVVDSGSVMSGSGPKSIEDRTRDGNSSAVGHNSCPTNRRYCSHFHRRRSSVCNVPHSSRKAADDYFSTKHHTGSGISWSDKAYDKITPDQKKDKK
ncbi:hypothetical protein V2G26_015627 [Clonostachys chloroleuca]